MAATRKPDQKIVGDSLDAFTQNLAKLFGDQLTVRNTKLELDFQEKVGSGDLSLSDQLAYRKSQLSAVDNDPTERTRLRAEISALKTRVTEEAYTQAYAAKIADYQAGMSSIDSVISFLTAQQASTNDPTTLDQIGNALASAQNQKYTIAQNVIKDQSTYAANSKSVSAISDQITKVTAARAQAVLHGQDDQVAVLDLQLQSLNQAKTDAQVQDQVLNLGAISTTGALGAVSLLNTMNSNISNADSNSGPVTVNGTTYSSVADFWTSRRDSYLSDQSTNGFFGSLDNELKNDVATLNSKNALTSDSLANLTKVFDTLGARPELAAYTKQIDVYKQDVLQTGANAITDTITNQFSRDLNIGNAVASLNTLKALGVNVDSAYTKILQSNAATKGTQVSNILGAAQNAMTNDPTLTPEAAIAAAVKAGSGTIITPNDAAGKTETQLATDAATTAAGGTGANQPQTTIPGAPAAPAGPISTPSGTHPTTVLQPGSTDTASVKQLQDYLVSQGYMTQAQVNTGYGIYGAQTTAAVAALQTKLGVDNTSGVGYYGPKTISAIGSTTPATPPVPAAAPAAAAVPAQAAAAPVVPQPAATPTATPAPTPVQTTSTSAPKVVSFTKLASGNIAFKYDNGTNGQSTLEYAKSIGYTGT